MAKYIIGLSYSFCSSREWYLGSTYVFQGERYPAVGGIDEAKRYSSRKRAERAAEIVCNIAGGIKGCEVVEVDDQL